MLARKIEIGKANLAWKNCVNYLNEQQPLVERKRVLRDGRVQYYHTRRKLVNQSLSDTAVQLIWDYMKAYEKALAMGFAPQETGELPTLFTNSPRLAEKCTNSDRTVRNHIRKLKQIGLITRYVFHGTFHDFELCINPLIMFAAEPTKVTNLLQPTKIAPAAFPESTDFPLNVSLETTCNIEREIRNVDKKGVAKPQLAMADADGTGDTLETSFSGHTGPHQGLVSAQNRPTGSMEAKKLATRAGGPGAGQKPVLNPVFKSFVEIFWAYAKEFLYPHLDFDEHQERLAKNAIYKGVYWEFKTTGGCGTSDADFENHHLRSMERLDLAIQYYRNHPDKYPPMPYAEWLPDTGYFDYENKRGFRKTLDWYIQKQVWAHQQKVSDALRRAKSDFMKHCRGKAPKRLQEKSPLQLFKMHEEKIRRLGKDALEKFYRQFTIPTN